MISVELPVIPVSPVVNETHPNKPSTLSGLVVAAHGKRFRVELSDGKVISCVTRGKKTGVACGDRVEVKLTAGDEGVIEKIAPRQSLLYRSDPFREKIIAANVTQIVIVVAAVPSFYEDLVNRCLVAAETAGIQALIVLNKADLAAETATAAERLALYERLGYPLLELCAHTDVSPLRAHLAGHTSVLVGQSGMGKSTLINGLIPEARARTREISEALDSGRHTTTHATLYHLDGDGQIIDSPGLQEFGLHHVSLDDLARAFVDFRPYIGQCRFHNCRHLVEPGCAIDAAAHGGHIDPRRLAAYRSMAEELLKWQALQP
jgi:ribosome biogenesis GTPase